MFNEDKWNTNRNVMFVTDVWLNWSDDSLTPPERVLIMETSLKSLFMTRKLLQVTKMHVFKII